MVMVSFLGENKKKKLITFTRNRSNHPLDQEGKDSNERLHAYIIKENNIHINKTMLQEGFDVTYYLYPNLK
jgi:endonuclease YncB( thermonuclease family)